MQLVHLTSFITFKTPCKKTEADCPKAVQKYDLADRGGLSYTLRKESKLFLAFNQLKAL